MGYPAAAQFRSFGSRAITSGQTKTPEPTTALLGLLSWAPAFNALASLDMQDDLLFAVPAENRQAIRLGLRGDPQRSLRTAYHTYHLLASHFRLLFPFVPKKVTAYKYKAIL